MTIRKVLVFVFVLLVLLTPVALTHAQIFDTIVPNCDTNCGWKDLVNLAQRIINFLVVFSTVVATLMFTYAGFLYLTARGNPGQLEKAHKIFVNVGIGFIFVLGAFLIVKLVLDTFGSKVEILS